MTPPTIAATVASGMQFAAGQLDSTVLRQAFGCFPSGVVAICAMMDGPQGPEPAGMVASSFVTVSLDPPLVAFCVQWTSTTWPRLEKAPYLGISVLAEEHHDVASQIASKSRDRFNGVPIDVTEEGAIFIKEASLWMLCSVESIVNAGDHGVVIMRIEGLSKYADTDPLVFHGSRFRALAHQNA